MDVVAALNDLGERVMNRNPYINNGGCCVFAAAVGEQLQKRGVETWVIVGTYPETFDDDEDGYHDIDIRYVEAKLKKKPLYVWNDNNIFFTHVGLGFRIGDRFYNYDSHGVRTEDFYLGEYMLYKGGLSVETARFLADQEDGWNECFDRSQIPDLRRYIRRRLAATLPLTIPS